MWDVFWNNARGHGDWKISEDTGDLETVDPIASAVVMLLFTDKPLPTPDSVKSRNATWHGNTFDNEGEGELGSYLWTLNRAIPNEELLLRARTYCAEALKPLIDQKVIRGVTIEVELQRLNANSVVLAIGVSCLSETDLSFFFKYPVA